MGEPREYDLTEMDEVVRLMDETRGYMKVSLGDGTDKAGRQFALDALEKIVGCGSLFFKLLPHIDKGE